MNFELEKKQCLEKIDQSRKGSVDLIIKDVLGLINASDRYYTTSSCSGRIMIMKMGEKKHESVWHFTSHDLVSESEFVSEIEKAVGRGGDIWLKFEPAILHVCCRSLEDADNLLKVCNDAGFKRGGIVAVGRRIIVEIGGVDKLETIIGRDGKVLAGNDYLKVLSSTANEKMERNKERLRMLKKTLRENL